MQHYTITGKQIYKNYIFLLSVVGGSAIWTTHSFEYDRNISNNDIVALYQKAHNKQVANMLVNIEREEKEYWAKQIIVDEAVQTPFN